MPRIWTTYTSNKKIVFIEQASERIGKVDIAIVCKIVPLDQWLLACHSGAFTGSDDDVRDGFIHLSAPSQVDGTLEKYFPARDDLLLVAFKSSDLGPNLKWETSRAGPLFPHLYEPLQPRLALWQKQLTRGRDGKVIVEKAWF